MNDIDITISIFAVIDDIIKSLEIDPKQSRNYAEQCERC